MDEHIKPDRELMWFQRLLRHEQKLYQPDHEKAKQLLTMILWRIKHE